MIDDALFMMTEDDLREANGLVARFYHPRTTNLERQRTQERLVALGIQVDKPLPVTVDDGA